MSSFSWPPNIANVPVYANLAAFPVSSGNGQLALALDTDDLYAFNTGSMTWVVIGGPGSLLSIGTIDSQTAATNGAVISGSSLVLQSASTSKPGLVNNTTQSFSGNKTFTGTISASNLSGTNTGDVTLTAVGSSPNANAASLTGQILTLQPANTSFPGILLAADWNTFNNKQSTVTIGALDAQAANATGLSLVVNVLSSQSADNTHPGMVNLTTQIFAGKKTFTNGIDVNSTQITNVLDPTTGQMAATKAYVDALSRVTSVALSVPSFLSISGSPITSSGTLAISLSGTALPVLNGGTGTTTSTGSGNVVLSTSPTLVTPALGTPTALVGTNISGIAASLTAGNVTTNANLTGPVTSTGNATAVTNNAITNTMLAQAATLTIKSNITGGTANESDNSVASVYSVLRSSLAKTADYTLSANDDVVSFDATGASRIATLPTAAGVTGKTYTVYALAIGANNVVLNTTSAQTIGGRVSGDIVLRLQGDYLQIQSDGTNWQILNKKESKVLTTSANMTFATIATDGNYGQLACSVALTYGVWRLNGQFIINDGDGSGIGLYVESGFYAADGANSSSAPTSLVTNNTQGVPSFSNFGTGASDALVFLPATSLASSRLSSPSNTIILQVAANTTVYLVPRGKISISAGTTARVIGSIYAERVW